MFEGIKGKFARIFHRQPTPRDVFEVAADLQADGLFQIVLSQFGWDENSQSFNPGRVNRGAVAGLLTLGRESELISHKEEEKLIQFLNQ